MLDRADKTARAPKTDNWSALENEYQSGTVMLLVSGKVEVTHTNKEPKLTEASGGGSTLILDLTIETGNYPGSEVLVWKPAPFSRRVGADEFRDVHIRWDGKVIARCKVIDDDQAHARLALHTEAANAKASIKMTAGKAKKAAKAVLDAVGRAAAGNAGKVAAGTAAVAAVGAAAVATAVSLTKPKAKKKTAKKAAKKATKKAAKKTTKKTAKKTAKKAAAKSAKKAKPKAASKSKAKSKAKSKTKVRSKAKAKSVPKKAAKRGAKKKRAKSRR